MSDGMNYAPKGKAAAVVKPGEFVFSVIGLDHGHIFGQTNGLVEAGATLKYVYDPDPAKVAHYRKLYPNAIAAESEKQVLEDAETRLVAAACVPCDRGPLGVRVMQHGKDYFTDKTPFTQMAHLDAAKACVKATGRKYMVYYSERLHVECAVYAGELIKNGEIGRVISVEGMGPHRLQAPTRPEWFFDKARYGGILCDIGSHQIEQYLYYSGAKDATVLMAQAGNYNNPATPGLEDFGHAMLVGDNGTRNYFRVDWHTPDAARVWGDGRTFIVGTEGYIELRKYIDVGRDIAGDQLYMVNAKGEQHMSLRGQVGFPYFGQLILDCINRTSNAMTQEHAFKAAELCIKAQELSDKAK